MGVFNHVRTEWPNQRGLTDFLGDTNALQEDADTPFIRQIIGFNIWGSLVITRLGPQIIHGICLEYHRRHYHSMLARDAFKSSTSASTFEDLAKTSVKLASFPRKIINELMKDVQNVPIPWKYCRNEPLHPPRWLRIIKGAVPNRETKQNVRPSPRTYMYMFDSTLRLQRQ